MAKGFLFPGGIVSLPKEAAERILRTGSGDAALLYLCLLSREDATSLKWPSDRLTAAFGELVRLELLDPEKPVSKAPEVPPEPVTPPTYSSEDITLALETASPFSALVEELQRRLGKLLSPADLQTLYTLYDYLALPAEVILLCAGRCMEEIARKYGPGRKPTLSQIKREAFHWRRLGVDTLEAAEAHLAKMAAQEETAARLLPLVGIYGREPLEAERRYLESWAEWPFDDESIRLAYEKTVLKKQSMNWAYMNSILRNWHQKGLHTKAEILAKDGPKRPAAPAGTSPAAQNDLVLQDMEQMEWLLKQSGGKKEG